MRALTEPTGQAGEGVLQRMRLADADDPDGDVFEICSALDGESEETIREALEDLMRGRTVIAIAHRLSTLRNFDRLVLMEDGQIVLDGPPERLIKMDSRLAEIAQAEARVRRAA